MEVRASNGDALLGRDGRRRITWLACALSVLATLIALAAAALPAAPARASTPAERAHSPLERVAAERPGRDVEVIVQLADGTSAPAGRTLLRAAGARSLRDLPIIHGFAARIEAGAAARLAHDARIHAVTLNGGVRPNATVDVSRLATAYPMSVSADKLWNKKALTGKGVGVAVIDTGIAGDLPDFRASQGDPSSRVVAAAVTNPEATTATDRYGHGTHVAGIIAGNGLNRPSSDLLYGRYIGVAPDAHLISIKASDDTGAATVLDVIYGLQFAVDHKADYNIRVVNLSLESSEPGSHLTDPLDAAVESAWLQGLVVIAASGNRGSDPDAVTYAPGNDPYVISVGAADDQGTKTQADDKVAPWTSYGWTQDGVAKPDVLAPGAHIVAPLAPASAFAALCPSCIVSGEYIRAGGTSMAAPVVAGVAAGLLEGHPEWTPDQVKGALVNTARPLPGPDVKVGEIVAEKALAATGRELLSNTGLTPNSLIDASTGAIDYTRATWSRATWSASDLLRATWSRATWSCDCSLTSSGTIDPTRATWSRATWSTSFSK